MTLADAIADLDSVSRRLADALGSADAAAAARAIAERARALESLRAAHAAAGPRERDACKATLQAVVAQDESLRDLAAGELAKSAQLLQEGAGRQAGRPQAPRCGCLDRTV